jgi:hypothetical protein
MPDFVQAVNSKEIGGYELLQVAAFLAAARDADRIGGLPHRAYL